MKGIFAFAAVVVCSASAGHAQDLLPAVSVRDVIVGEGDTARFPVELSRPALGKTRVTWKTRAVTASAGVDYAPTAGELVLERGEMARTIDVSVLQDIRPEGSEAFILELTSATSATIADGLAHGVILDTRVPPRCALGDDSGSAIVVRYPVEGGGVWTDDPSTHGAAHDLWAPTSTIIKPGMKLPESHWEVDAAGDFAGNGTCQLLWGMHDPPRLALTDTSRVPHGDRDDLPGITRPGHDWQVVGAANLDGEGPSDLLWWNDEERTFQFWRGGPGFPAGVLDPAKCDPESGVPVAVGRTSADGSTEIFWQDGEDVKYWSLRWVPDIEKLVCLGQGTLMSGNARAQIAAAGDFDGDGFDDLLLHEPDPNSAPILTACFLRGRQVRACSAVSLDGLYLGAGAVVGPR
jgi:Calx-beta domain